MALSENAKNWIATALMAICGYLFVQLVQLSSDVNSSAQTIASQRVILRLHIVDLENRVRVLENANCGKIKTTVLQ